MLARGNYGARVIELKGLIAAEEEKFKYVLFSKARGPLLTC